MKKRIVATCICLLAIQHTSFLYGQKEIVDAKVADTYGITVLVRTEQSKVYINSQSIHSDMTISNVVDVLGSYKTREALKSSPEMTIYKWYNVEITTCIHGGRIIGISFPVNNKAAFIIDGDSVTDHRVIMLKMPETQANHQPKATTTSSLVGDIKIDTINYKDVLTVHITFMDSFRLCCERDVQRRLK